jgi:hypothetical protein
MSGAAGTEVGEHSVQYNRRRCKRPLWELSYEILDGKTNRNYRAEQEYIYRRQCHATTLLRVVLLVGRVSTAVHLHRLFPREAQPTWYIVVQSTHAPVPYHCQNTCEGLRTGVRWSRTHSMDPSLSVFSRDDHDDKRIWALRNIYSSTQSTPHSIIQGFKFWQLHSPSFQSIALGVGGFCPRSAATRPVNHY